MRLLAPLLVCAALGAADVSIGQWNGMLLVTAPAGDGLSQLGGRLAQRITLDAREQSLTDTAEFLRGVTGLNIVVGPELLAQPPAITLQVKDMALGHVFTWISRTADVHIGYVNEAVYISRQPVAGAATTRLYDVSDLALPLRHFPGPELTIPQPGGTGSLISTPPEPTEEGRYDLESIVSLLNNVVNKQK
jgi:hypothetical protein